MATKTPKIILKHIGHLQPYEFNNRIHNDEQIQAIASSIKEFGFDQPILINQDGLIIAGHGRWLAAQQLGLEQVPCVVTTLDEVKERARRILDNKIQNDSLWDWNNLELEVGWLEDEGFDVKTWGLERFIGSEVDDPSAEWDNMPEFTENDTHAHQSIRLHFPDENAVQEFARLLGQKITPKTKYLWYPEQEQNDSTA